MAERGLSSEDINCSETDEDLDNLLDSALDDFNKTPSEEHAQKVDEPEESIPGNDVEAMWSEMMKQALLVDPNLKDMFQNGITEESSFAQDFSKIAEAAAKMVEGDSSSNFAEIMSETLRNLNENSETIQNQLGNPEELANLFQELGLNEDAERQQSGSMGDMPPFMMNIMQSFLSKDILYPSMKEFVDKYTVWLEEHKDTEPAEQHGKYTQQLVFMKKVVEEFEAEVASDNDDVKRQRFQRIIGHLQQLQSLGHPPAELISLDGLDEGTLPNLPPGMDPSQCSVM